MQLKEINNLHMKHKRKAYQVLIGFSFFIAFSAFGQEQKIADSLAIIYNKKDLHDTAKFELLYNLAFNENNDLFLAIKYTDELIALSERLNNSSYLYKGYYLKGNKYKRLGNLDAALEAYIRSAEVAKQRRSILGEGTVYSAIATVFKSSNNYTNAMVYFRKAISALRQANDSVTLATVILNTGEAFRVHQDYDSALRYFTEASSIFEKVNYPIGKAYGLGNIGMVYASTGKNNLAEKNINEAIAILEALQDYYPICSYLISMADIYAEKENLTAAISYASRSLQLASYHKLKQEMSGANLKLSELYEKAGRLKESLSHYKDYVMYRDSVNNISTVQKMADLRTDFEVSQKQVEVDLLNQQKKNQRIIQIGSAIIFGLIITGLSFSFWQKQQSNKKLKAQQIIIEERNGQLQELNESKDTLFSIIGHDLKGPLSAINLLSRLMSNNIDTFTGEERKILFRDLDSSLKNLFKLLENLLEWSRSQIGHLNFKPEIFDIAAILRENRELFEGQAAEKKIDIVYDNSSLLLVNAHVNSVSTVVRNLLSNAIKFTPAGGTITIHAEQTDTHLRVSVTDTGLGISEATVQKLFKVGTHYSTPGTAKEKGTGLGLMLCKDFVEKNGGSIGVESTEGKGSTFYFTVPLASLEESSALT
jgi:two-component system NtrC family sensor kinase